MSISKRALLLLTLAAGACSACCAQGLPRLTFELASIHPANPDETRGYVKAMPGGMGYSAQNISIGLIFALMYKVPARQISGFPSWFTDTKFDIEARADHAYSIDDLHTMMMNLMADRFGVRFHIENREGNVYALSVDKGGPKMKTDTAAEDFSVPITFGPQGAIGHHVSLVYLTWWLGQQLQDDKRPVIDETGLTGFYDFGLSFLPVLPPDVSVDTLPAEVRERPALPTAVREQLGLKLTAQRGPVPYYLIDAAHLPSDN